MPGKSAFAVRNKKPVLNRVHRIHGQVTAIAKALESEQECGAVLQLIASVRGATDSLMTVVLKEHLRLYAEGTNSPQGRAKGADQVIGIVRAYLR